MQSKSFIKKTIPRFAALLIISSLLFSAFGSVASYAAAGTSSDPLVSRSYISDYFSDYLYNLATAKITAMINALKTEINGGGKITANAGGAVQLTLGGSVTITGGTAKLFVTKGTVINLTTGETVSTGATLTTGNRYLAAEDTSASVVFRTAGTFFTDGAATLTSTGGDSVTFTDISKSNISWGYDAISYIVSIGAIEVSGTTFSPYDIMTRADFVTILGKTCGLNTADYPYDKSLFTDVKGTEAYAPYVQWAARNGIVNGIGNNLFNPNGEITRMEMAAIITRYAAYCNKPLSYSSTPSIADDSDISSWAKEYVYAVWANGVMIGVGENMFDPWRNITKSEVCVLAKRVIEL